MGLQSNLHESSIRRTRVVPRDALAHEPTGNRRGYAHIGFDDHPVGAPGRLDFDPLLLFAQGCMLPGEGFDLHSHDNIENLLIVRRGLCRHRDRHGTRILQAGEVLGMSAGHGIEHAEHVFGDEPLEALVIWLRPDVRDTAPSVAVRPRGPQPSPGRWSVLASGRADAPPDALALRCDAQVLTARVPAGRRVTHWLGPDRRAYVVPVGGMADIEGRTVGDGARVLVDGGGTVSVLAHDLIEVYLVDMGPLA